MLNTKIIAEAGINAANDFNKLLQMATVAKAAKANAIKIQKREPRVSIPKHMWNVPKKTPWGPTMPYIEYKEALEFSIDQCHEFDRWCKTLDIEWSTSVWDTQSLAMMTNEFDLPWLKIPSAHATNEGLIRACADWSCQIGRPLYISVGMTTEEEIDECWAWIVDTMGSKEEAQHWITLMHCHSSYPAPINEINLSCIPYIKKKYGCHVGYSSHENFLVTKCAAIYLGANLLEAHFTLDREGGGTDDQASLSSWGLAKWIDGVRKLEEAYGDGKIRVYDSELPNRKKLRGV